MVAAAFAIAPSLDQAALDQAQKDIPSLGIRLLDENGGPFDRCGHGRFDRFRSRLFAIISDGIPPEPPDRAELAPQSRSRTSQFGEIMRTLRVTSRCPVERGPDGSDRAHHPFSRQARDTYRCLASSHAELGLSAPGNAEPQLGAQPTPSRNTHPLNHPPAIKVGVWDFPFHFQFDLGPSAFQIGKAW